MNDRRPGFALAFLVLLLIGCAVFWLARWQQALMTDFKTFYAAAATASAGEDFYDAGVLNATARATGIRGHVFPYLYTPVLAYLARPWQELAPEAALRFLIGLNGVLLVPLLVLVGFDSRAKVAHLLGVQSDAPFLWAAIVLFATNFHETIELGQINILVLLLIILLLHFVRTGRDTLGGIFLGLASLLKVTPLLLLFWLAARGRYKAVLSCLLTLPGVAAITLAMGAGAAWRRFFAFLPKTSYGSDIPGLFPAGFFPNFSLAGFLSRLLPNRAAVVQIATVALLGALLATFVWIVRTCRDEKVAELMLLPFLVLMVIASPLTYVHHVLYVAPGLVLALSYAWAGLRGWRRAAVVTSLVLAASAAGIHFPRLYRQWSLSPLETKLFTSLNLYALLVCLAVALALALDLKAAPPAAEGTATPAVIASR